MLSPNNPTPHSTTHAVDQIPDFYQIRERAHHERTKAINMAVSMVWNRLAGRRSRQDRDANFWTA